MGRKSRSVCPATLWRGTRFGQDGQREAQLVVNMAQIKASLGAAMGWPIPASLRLTAWFFRAPPSSARTPAAIANISNFNE